MPRSTTRHHDRDVVALRSELAGVAVEVGFIRVERMLARKYRSDQPRAPAGQPDGGRWVSAPSGGARWMSANSGGQAETQIEEAVTECGSRVLSIRIRANARADWDAQHTVTAPDGTRTVFETSGLTQTIRVGETGEILGRSTLTADGAESGAFSQPARGLPGKLGQRISRTLEAAGTPSRCSLGGVATVVKPCSQRLRVSTSQGTHMMSGPYGWVQWGRPSWTRFARGTGRCRLLPIRSQLRCERPMISGPRRTSEIRFTRGSPRTSMVGKIQISLQRRHTIQQRALIKILAQKVLCASTYWSELSFQQCASTTTKRGMPT